MLYHSQSHILVAFAILLCSTDVRSLHDVEIKVPNAVLVGDMVTLECNWQLDDDEALYNVKWYRRGMEFFRYIPKELPHTRVFPQLGLDVDMSRSGARRVVLQQASSATAGRFRCEVCADAPIFDTVVKSASLEVVELPDWSPKLITDRSWYEVGSTINATCASPPSQPAANLTFTLNGIKIEMTSLGNELPEWFKWDLPQNPDQTTTKQQENKINENEIRRLPKESVKPVYERSGPDSRRLSVGETSFVVRADSFERGTLRLTCIANIYDLYSARSELIFDMEQPKPASVGMRRAK